MCLLSFVGRFLNLGDVYWHIPIHLRSRDWSRFIVGASFILLSGLSFWLEYGPSDLYQVSAGGCDLNLLDGFFICSLTGVVGFF